MNMVHERRGLHSQYSMSIHRGTACKQAGGPAGPTCSPCIFLARLSSLLLCAHWEGKVCSAWMLWPCSPVTLLYDLAGGGKSGPRQKWQRKANPHQLLGISHQLGLILLAPVLASHLKMGQQGPEEAEPGSGFPCGTGNRLRQILALGHEEGRGVRSQCTMDSQLFPGGLPLLPVLP